MIRNKDFYKIRLRNYHYQLIVFKKKLTNLKNEFKKIRQINEKLQQEVNELKTINKAISFNVEDVHFVQFRLSKINVTIF